MYSEPFLTVYTFMQIQHLRDTGSCLQRKEGWLCKKRWKKMRGLVFFPCTVMLLLYEQKVIGHCCMNLKDLSCVCFDQLYKEMEELKEQNKTLQEIAGQAEYFASLYQVHAVMMQKSVLTD